MTSGCRRQWSWIALLLMVLYPARPSHGQEFPTGQLVEHVRCQADGSQSYALYLPSNYSPQRRWPILYGLDAGARGYLPVQHFRSAAEKYGYIVAGSNNSRNGPMTIVNAAIQAMLEDTRARFSIDDRRVYFSGFSGGARVAVSTARSLSGTVAGVIGCSGGLPAQLDPSAGLPFAYFGIAGTEDFNFPEMRQLNRLLDRSGVPHRLALFEGPHEWPPEDICMTAIEWMELQAVRTGTRTTDAAFLDGMLQKASRKAANDEASGRTYDAFLEYEALGRDFKGLRDVAEFKRNADELRDSRALQRDVRKEREDADAQNRWVAKLMGLKAGYAGAEDPAQVLVELRRSLFDLKERAESKTASGERLVARRVRSLFVVLMTDEARDSLASADYGSAAFSLSLASQARPDSPRLLYNLACAYALGGKNGDAVAALRRAIDSGFTDVGALETDPGLERLRKEPAFQAILGRLKRRP